MTSIDEKSTELVALGAAIGGNCIPCLKWHYKKCLELGISKNELQHFIDTALKVKEVPIKKIYETTERLLNKDDK